MAIDELDLSALAPGVPIRAANTGNWFDLGYPTSADRLIAATVTGGGIGARTFAAGANSASRSLSTARQTKGRIGWKMEFLSSLTTTTSYFEMLALRFNTAAGFLVDVGLRHNSTTLKRYVGSRNNFAYIGQANAGNAFDLAAGAKWSFEVYWDGTACTVSVWIGEDVSDAPDFTWAGTFAQAPTNFMFGNDSNDGVETILYDLWVSDGERQAGPPTPGTLTWLGNWDARHDRVQVVGKVANAQEVSLLLDGATVDALPDANGYFRIDATGLDANTAYPWEVFVDGVSRLTGSISTLPAPGSSGSHRIIVGSCLDAYSSGVFALLAARNADLIFWGGDRGYTFISTGPNGGVSPTTADAVRPLREEFYATTAARSLVDYAFPMAYIYSDCDGGGGNADSTTGGLATGAVQSVYRQQTANVELPLAATAGRSFVIGPFRYIITDETTAASAKGNADVAGKTKLGVEQLAWFLNELEEAATAQQAVIWLGDGPFHPPTASGGTSNEWSRYNAERTVIVAKIAETGVQILRANGDRHALAADTGVNNAFGGFPTVNAAPFHTTANPYGMTASQGSWPTVQTNSARQYAVLDLDHDTMTVTARGYSSTNAAPAEVERFTLTADLSYPAPGAGHQFIQWDGATETELSPIFWDGATETPLTATEA